MKTLTIFRRPLDHVELVNLFSVVLGLSVVLSAALVSVLAKAVQQIPGAVIEGQHLVGHLTRTQGLRWAGQAEFAEDLTPDGLHPLLLNIIDVHSGAGGQRQAHGHTV